jgi:NAD(P)-dependent dehydrogenase (short-subunit alcohol dehydrogenase family)
MVTGASRAIGKAAAVSLAGAGDRGVVVTGTLTFSLLAGVLMVVSRLRR